MKWLQWSGVRLPAVNGQRRAAALGCLALTVLVFGGGCATTLPDRAERMERGYVYYLDGAGGGSILTNWSGGVRRGLREAGYDGAGEMFRWETGLGVVADQVASEAYKRQKAAELASKIEAYQREHPRAKIALVGLSAGTAVAIFALEALPENVQVDTVVLLSGSLSAHHDLTRALQRLRDRLYIFTSARDTVLQGLVPLVGTADRVRGDAATVGVDGAQLPAGASDATRRLYEERVVEIPWNEEFIAYGHRGGHTDSVKGPFVRYFVAPFIAPIDPAKAQPSTRRERGKVMNPDYARWADFEPGAWTRHTVQLEHDGQRIPFELRAELVFKSDVAVLVERDPELRTAAVDSEIARHLFVTAMIEPKNNPLTHPEAVIERQADQTLMVGGRAVACEVRMIRAPGRSLVWGEDIAATVHSSPAVPGAIVKLELETTIDGQRLRYRGMLADFGMPSATADAAVVQADPDI